MSDPLAEIVTLLQPQAPFSKLVTGAGPWRVSRVDTGQPFYLVVLSGRCLLTCQGNEPILLYKGDFALIPEAQGFSVASVDPEPLASMDTTPVELLRGEYQLGDHAVPSNVRMLVGHCEFHSADAALLVSLLPQLILVRGEDRLTTLVQLVRDESLAQRPARDVILAKLMEVLLLEVLRSSSATSPRAGLLRGMADERTSKALRLMHSKISYPWTVAELAKKSALSRSAFFERFRNQVGVTPMEYLLNWRMALAKSMLQSTQKRIADIAETVGYGSASAFSVAFTRHVGVPPSEYVGERLE